MNVSIHKTADPQLLTIFIVSYDFGGVRPTYISQGSILRCIHIVVAHMLKTNQHSCAREETSFWIEKGPISPSPMQ